MFKRPIRDLRSTKPVPPHFCDVEVVDGKAKLVWRDKKKYKEIYWEDMKHQVEAAIEDSK